MEEEEEDEEMDIMQGEIEEIIVVEEDGYGEDEGVVKVGELEERSASSSSSSSEAGTSTFSSSGGESSSSLEGDINEEEEFEADVEAGISWDEVLCDEPNEKMKIIVECPEKDGRSTTHGSSPRTLLGVCPRPIQTGTKNPR